MSDDGLAYVCPQGSALIASYDVPLFYFGEMAHHPIRLCDNREENNRRPVCSWVMNNTWETNFKMDLSGFGQYRYTLWLSGETDPQRALEELEATLPAQPAPEREVLQAVLSLPKKYRLPLYLYYYEGYSVGEIGAILGRNPSTIQTHLARGRERLKAMLTEEVQEHG